MFKLRMAALSVAVLSVMIPPAWAQESRSPQGAGERLAPAKANVARVVRYSELFYLTKGTAQAAASRQQQEQLARLRTEISANPSAQEALAAAGFSTEDVVATTLSADGVLLMFVDDL